LQRVIAEKNGPIILNVITEYNSKESSHLLVDINCGFLTQNKKSLFNLKFETNTLNNK
jgi:hypothetical protein